MLLGDAKFKLYCAEFEQEQLQAWMNLLEAKTHKQTHNSSVCKQGTPQDIVVGRQRRTHKHSTAAFCHLSKLERERRSRNCYVRKAEVFTDEAFHCLFIVPSSKGLKNEDHLSFITIHALMKNLIDILYIVEVVCCKVIFSSSPLFWILAGYKWLQLLQMCCRG